MEVDLTPRLGLEFDSLEESRNFWVAYAGRTRFGARKYNKTKSKKDGSIVSARYVCCKEGLRTQDKRDFMTSKPRPETRTNCKAKMSVACVEGKYRINAFFEEHNHLLHPPETVHLLASQRKVTEVQAYEIDLAEDSGLQQKSAFELMSRHAGGRANLGYTQLDVKNYLRTKRQRSMAYGEAGCLLRYFQEQYSENPSFYHAYQMDAEEQITNIFWADARMLLDYAYFGDVVSMDTTFSTNRDHRPLALLSGFNHYKGVVIFGAALLYDETIESFKWLLQTFLEAHQQKRPFTIFTDQDQAMIRAIQEVMPDTKHGLCTWHLMQNGVKHLGNLMKGGSHFLTDFKKCMHQYEEEAQFEEEWRQMLSSYDVNENRWLTSVYNIKEKWAWCHMRKAFTLGVRSTQVSESINAAIKSCTRPDLDINQFFKQFERVVNDRRYNELKHEFDSRQKLPRLIVQSSPMLRQLSHIYTAPIFDLFQEQWDQVAAACIKNKKEESHLFDYVVNMVDEEGEWKVQFDPNSLSISCSCRKFETVGILCCHALKVFDVRDMKKLPERYIIKRWTKDARRGVIHDIRGNEVQADPRLESTRRYRELCPIMIRLATEASDCPEAFSLVQKGVSELIKQVTELRLIRQSPTNDGSVSTSLPIESNVQTKGFKKRDGRRKKRREKSWIEKLKKRRRRIDSTDNQMQANTSNIAPQTTFAQASTPQEILPRASASQMSVIGSQIAESDITYTQMLMAPMDFPMPSLEALEFSQYATSGINEGFGCNQSKDRPI